MATVAVYNIEGKEVDKLELNDNVFGVEINEHLVHLAVVSQLANGRQGTQSAKTRSEVSGGGRKPWRQKGTGRARQGSTRSPQWTHGGVALGPKPRSYRMSLNKKTKRIALYSALSAKVAEGNLIVVDSIKTAEYKTKNMVAMLKAFEAEKKALVVLDKNDAVTVKSCANIPGVKTSVYNTINVYDILNADKFIVSKDAVKGIEEVFA